MARKNGKQAEPQPEFNFEDVSRRWEKDFRRVNMRLVRAAQLMESDISAEATAEQRRELVAMRLQAVDDFDEIESDRDALLARVLVDVPRNWLVSDAPDSLDWSDPESLDWLKAGKLDELIAAMGEARSSKN